MGDRQAVSARGGRWATMTAAAVAATLLGGCRQAGGVDAMAAVSDPYARAERLVKLPDGRRLNLRCSGRGSPTVLLESGFGAGSSAWVKVRPALSRETRVCAYDRAGYGFSDPGPLPRDAAAIARDLDQALQAAHIEGPFIVVGHSAGGMYARVFAARRPNDIAGLVLLDPTVEHHAPIPGDGLDGLRRRVRGCLAAAQADPQAPLDKADWQPCIPAKTNAHDLAVIKRPATWEAQLSELDQLFSRATDQVVRAYPQLADIPIYVITASATSGASLGRYDGRTQLEYAHLMMAKVSHGASQRTVNSSHLVMLDRPDVVIAAVSEMIDAARAHREPAPLPPSEAPTEGEGEVLKGLFTSRRGLFAPPDLTPPPAAEAN